MATRTRASIPVKEKRGTSPSSHAPHTGQAQAHRRTSPSAASHTGQAQAHRRSPSASKTSSTVPAHDSSDKHVPNYLKATHSSSTDVSKQQGKKPVSGDATHNKPNAARRKSLDKSASHLSTQKPHITANPVPRSHSSVGRPVHSSSRTVPDKNLKTTKEPAKKGVGGSGGSSYGKPVKKKTIYVKKGTVSGTPSTPKEKSAITPEKVENHHEPDITEPEMKIEEHASSVTEPEEHVAQDETNHEKAKEDDIQENEDKDVTSVKETGEETNIDANVVNVEPPTEIEKHEPPQDVKIEPEPEGKIQVEETDNKIQELEIDMNETSVIENPKEEVVQKEEVAQKEEVPVNIKEEDVIGTVEKNEENEKETVQEVAKEEKNEADNNSAVKPSQVAAAQGKKDSPVSNGVIEECASKLREQRKNKVKALAGAFETVISLQDK